MNRPWLVLWSVAMLASFAVVGQAWRAGYSIETDFVALLPEVGSDPVLRDALGRGHESASRRLILMASDASDGGKACAAVAAVAAELATSGVARDDADALANALPAIFGSERAAPALLSRVDRADLLAGDPDAVLKRALARHVMPFGMAAGGSLANDPFLLLPAFLAEAAAGGGLSIGSAQPTEIRRDDGHHCVVARGLRGNPFTAEFQGALATTLDRAIAAAARTHPGIDIKTSSPALFAAAAGASVARELAWLGTLALAGVGALAFWAFRSVGPVLLAAFAIGCGALAGLAATLAAFSTLHSFTLLFGTTLIGTAVDYALYYCCARLDPTSPTPKSRLDAVLPGIALGLVTSLVGYLALLAVPMPGLKQIAVFSGAGLIAAFLTVVACLPRLDRAKSVREPGRTLALARGIEGLWHGAEFGKGRRLAVGALILVGAIGAFRFGTDDDVRNYHRPSQALVEQDQAIRAVLGRETVPVLVAVEGRDGEEALIREEALIDALIKAKPDAPPGAILALSRFLPSRARQAENARLIDERLSGAPLEALRRAIGPAAGASAAAERDRSLAFEDLPAEARAGLATFRLGEADRNGTLVVVGGGWTREETARVVAGLPGVRLVDPAREISALFAAQRRGALAVVGASLAAILAIAAFRFGGRAALRVIAPPVAAVLLAPLVSAALFGPGFTFFDAMALALVAALGADYALFWAEAAEGRRPVALLSIALASATTLLAFGLLAFSSVRAVAAFGSTVFVGIVLAALFAPLARGRAR